WVAVPAALRAAAVAVLVARWLVYLALIARWPQLRIVAWDQGVTLAALAAFGVYGRLRGLAWAEWVLAGVGVTLVGAVVQRGVLAPHRHFNHNDVFHVLQTFALYLYYRAGARLADGQPARVEHNGGGNSWMTTGARVALAV